MFILMRWKPQETIPATFTRTSLGATMQLMPYKRVLAQILVAIKIFRKTVPSENQTAKK